jgi:uncharacterized protein YfaS (alpha-2-macroglobulin family)
MRLTLLTLLTLALAPVAITPGGDPPEPVTSEQLGGAERHAVHVSTDKPVYRSGETLRARGVVLNVLTRAPLANIPWIPVEIVGPKGDAIVRANTSGSDGVVAFTWTVPDGQPGGSYVLKMGGEGGPVVGERAFEVRAFRAPRINTQVVFLRDGYGAGDLVSATLSATRAEGGAPVGASVTLVAMVDGVEVARQPAGNVGADGFLGVSFRLPETTEKGLGTLALVIEDGGVVETATKSIPILLEAVDVAVYPEGGDLVAGIPTRVYVEARTPADKPADILANVETRDGKIVATFRTEHEGRGRVRLDPVAGEQYQLRIIEPAGIVRPIPLPAVTTSGGVVASVDDVARARRPLRLRVAATVEGAHVVTVSMHEKEVARREVDLLRGEIKPLALDLPDEASGVLRVTLWDDAGFPLAERLVFRQPADEVKLVVTCDRPRYVPADVVELHVKATRPDGSPASAMIGLSVSDDSVRELLETRDQPPQLPVQVLVENDVRELADAAVYLDPTNPKAPRAMDLLLGTQGWRRFALFGDVSAFVAEHGDAARRALALMEPARPASMPMEADDGVAVGGLGGFIDKVKSAVGLADKRALMAPAAAQMPEAAGAELLAPAEGGRLQARVDLDAEHENEPIVAKEELRERRQALRAGDKKDNEFFRDEQGTVFAREYAHVVRADRQPGDRVDFTDTVYWNAGVKTDASGEADVRFTLSDSVTSFRVLCDAFTEAGALGAGTRLIESVEPFYLEPKLPLEVTYGDRIQLPITAVNGTTSRLSGVTLVASATGPLSVGTLPPLSLGEGDRVRSLLAIGVGSIAGNADITILGRAGDYRDSVTRSLRVVPLGFPVSQSVGGLLGPGARVSLPLNIPRDLVAASVHADVKVFPSSLGKLTSALERLIQEPYGCFEQTSSTTYPLVMAAQYFESHQGVDPALVTRSQEMLGKGYERLTGFECKTRGYEWFGESPGHEALSAFGLLEFTDMSKVRAVDAPMLARTREWLLATRDGKGGFKRERRALHTWIEDEDCSNAYILWALLQTGEPAKSLGPEIDALAKAARASKNGYVHALAANVMQLADRGDDASALLSTLASHQATDGSLDSATASIVGSSGEALTIEATSLATLAWLRSPAHQANVEKAIHYLAEACQGGRYGSTQSTVLALRAIVDYDAARNRPRAAGSVTLLVDGKPIGAPIAFDEKTDSALQFADAGSALVAGPHVIELVMQDGSEMPFAVEVKFNRQSPESSPDCPLALGVELTSDRFVEGEIGEATVVLTSHSSEPLPMAVAIVGLPGGLEPRHEQLKELVRSKTVAAYEVIGREIVLYFRSLEPNAEKRIPLSLVAAVPGTYTGPASRAYLYYGDENKAWTPGFKVEIAAR